MYPEKQYPPPKIKRKILGHWLLGGLSFSLGLALFLTTLITGGLPTVSLLPIACVSLFLTLALGAPSYISALKELFRSRSLNLDCFVALNSLLILGISFAALIVPWLPMMFEAGLLLF